AGEVEEPEDVVVADVEEEVAGARVIPVLHQFHQREAEKLLVELDRLLDVLADQGEMVHALHGGGRPLTTAAQVLLAQLLPARPDLLEFFALRLWHGSPPCVIAAGVMVRWRPPAQGSRAGPGRAAGQPGAPASPGAGNLRGDAATAALDPVHAQPAPQHPAVQATARLGEAGGRHGQDRALRVGQAVTAHPAVAQPGQAAALSRT